MVDYFNLTYNLKITLEDLHSGIFKRVMAEVDRPREEVIEGAERFLLSPAFNPAPLPHAIEVITKLETQYELVIITARGDFLEKKTHEWLQHHFSNTFRGVRLVGVVGWGRGFDSSKGVELQKMGAIALIDDNLRHCTDAASLGIRGILFGTYSWNRAETLPPGVVRARDWLEVEQQLYHG